MSGVFLGCFAFQLWYLPFHASNLLLVAITADKVVVIAFSFKHKRIMTPRVVAAVVSSVWLLAVTLTAYGIVNVKGFEVWEYGVWRELIFCVFVISFLLSMVISSTTVIILNFHLTIKANKIHKQIELETLLPDQSENVTSLKKKHCIIRQNRKLIITLLVVILGIASINMILAVFFFVGRVWITLPSYHDLMGICHCS